MERNRSKIRRDRVLSFVLSLYDNEVKAQYNRYTVKREYY